MWGPNVASSQAGTSYRFRRNARRWQRMRWGARPLPRRILRGVARPVGNKSLKALPSRALRARTAGKGARSKGTLHPTGPLERVQDIGPLDVRDYLEAAKATGLSDTALATL